MEITQEFLRSRFAYEDGKLIHLTSGKGRRKGQAVGTSQRVDGYENVSFGSSRVSQKKQYRAHRLIWVWHFGPVPEGLDLDHIDGNKFNNRIENLRLATRRQNMQNMRPRNGRRYKGVHWNRERGVWRAEIRDSMGKKKFLGSYDNVADAAQAYNFAAIQYFGEFARLNDGGGFGGF